MCAHLLQGPVEKGTRVRWKRSCPVSNLLRARRPVEAKVSKVGERRFGEVSVVAKVVEKENECPPGGKKSEWWKKRCPVEN